MGLNRNLGQLTEAMTESAGNVFLKPNNTVGGTNFYIGQTMATNDTWSIYGNTIALDRGELVFELGDNAGASSANGQRFRFFYNSNSSGTAKSPFILDYNDATFNTNASFTGNVGIGTTSPSAILHTLKSGTPITSIGDEVFIGQRSGTGENAAFTLVSNGESMIRLTNTSSVELGRILYNTNSNFMRFDVNSAERMRITSGGNVGIGTTSAPNRVTIQGPAQGIALSWTDALSNTGYLRIRAGAAAVGADDILLLETAGTARLTILANGNYFFSGTNISDSRAKHNIKDLEFNFLEKIIALQPKSYHMKYDLEKIKYGFIAQEVNEVLPDLIGGDLEGEDFVGLDYDGLIPVLVGAIKELQQQINNLKNGN